MKVKVFDANEYVTRELPLVKFGDKIYPVNSRKSNIENMYAQIKKNTTLDDSDKEADRIMLKSENVMLRYLIGEDAAIEIIDMDLPYSDFVSFMGSIWAVVLDIPFPDAVSRFRKFTTASDD